MGKKYSEIKSKLEIETDKFAEDGLAFLRTFAKSRNKSGLKYKPNAANYLKSIGKNPKVLATLFSALSNKWDVPSPKSNPQI
ncbi:MAG: hypothetical protein IPH33_16255 [Bacteroidetes bacterium]|nr:hypothetical protein [Bacteroidota bacterium]